MPKMIVKVRPKPLPKDINYSLSEYLPIAKRHSLPNHWGFLTATNSRMFIGFQILYTSVLSLHDANMAVVDLGMTQKQLDWCSFQKNLLVLKNKPWSTKQFYWEAWQKPFYCFLHSPFEYTVWLDADMIVLNDLTPFIARTRLNPVFTCDYSTFPENTLNKKRLYELLPLPGQNEDQYPYLNTGIFCVHRKRDATLLQEWCYCVLEAMGNPEISDSISCWDQGACKWALQETSQISCIQDGIEWNYPAIIREIEYPAVPQAVQSLLKDVTSLKYCANVVHWMGSPKPWSRWGEVLNITF